VDENKIISLSDQTSSSLNDKNENEGQVLITKYNDKPRYNDDNVKMKQKNIRKNYVTNAVKIALYYCLLLFVLVFYQKHLDSDRTQMFALPFY
jgi:hypothetical protein